MKTFFGTADMRELLPHFKQVKLTCMACVHLTPDWSNLEASVKGFYRVPCSVQKPTINIPFFERSTLTHILCDKHTDTLSDTLVGTLSEIYSDNFGHVF